MKGYKFVRAYKVDQLPPYSARSKRFVFKGHYYFKILPLDVKDQFKKEKTKTFRRYSVVYMDVKSNYSGMSIRAEVVNPESGKGIIEKLKAKLDDFLISERAKGNLQGKFFVKTGFEKEEIDSVEASNYELNKITVEWS